MCRLHGRSALRALSDAIPALRSLPAALGLCPPLALAHIAHSAAGIRHLRHSALSVGASRKPFRACLGGCVHATVSCVPLPRLSMTCVLRLRSHTHARLSKLQTSYKRASRAPTARPARPHSRLHLIKILNLAALSVNQNLSPLKIPHLRAHFHKVLTFPPFCV